MDNCLRCGWPLERRAREGFLERDLLHHVGFYPWQCWDCQITYYRRSRNAAKFASEDVEGEEDRRLKSMVQKRPALTPQTPRIIDVRQFLEGQIHLRKEI